MRPFLRYFFNTTSYYGINKGHVFYFLMKSNPFHIHVLKSQVYYHAFFVFDLK